MALEGELDEPAVCPDDGNPLPLAVQRSAAGYYLGTFCNQCGPYSRLSDYFPTVESAEAELKLWQEENVRPSGRDTEYRGR